MLTNGEWRILAKRCRYRAFDESNRKRGNPLCTLGCVGARCTFAYCQEMGNGKAGHRLLDAANIIKDNGSYQDFLDAISGI